MAKSSARVGRGLLTIMLTLLLSMVLIVGATYALFTGEATVNNHLKAGNLKVGLERTSYQAHVLDNDTGRMVTTDPDVTRVDLTKDPKELFVVENSVPTCWYKADILVTNKGTVAFNYGMRIIWDLSKVEESEKPYAEAFAKQIEITVTYGENEAKFLLEDFATNDIDLGYLERNASGTFTVMAEFLNDEDTEEFDNDYVQEKEIKFDLQVYAEQKID